MTLRRKKYDFGFKSKLPAAAVFGKKSQRLQLPVIRNEMTLIIYPAFLYHSFLWYIKVD